MKKTFLAVLIIGTLFLSGCSNKSEKTPGVVIESPQEFIKDTYLEDLTEKLNQQIEVGTITPEEAKESFKNSVVELQELNNGSVTSILEKLALIDPQTATEFEKKIRANHPELFEE